METIDRSAIVEALRKLGLGPGSVVNVHSRLHAVGRIRGLDAAGIPAAYLSALQEVIGPSGTVVVPTYTTAFARFGRPFVLEETPSEMGVLSEFVRKQSGARRLLHPVVSLAALGIRAEELTADHPRWNVGHDTIWDRMLRSGGIVLTIGISPALSMSFMHQVEFMACVPYLYHKIMRGDVRAGGANVPGDFLMAVRYLGYRVEYDLARLYTALEETRAVTRVPLGGDAVWAVSMSAAFETGMRGLRSDPYYLLRGTPTFVEGEIPLDGITAGREAVLPRYFLT